MKVVQVKLSDVGISDYGKLTTMGNFQQTRKPMEIFFDGEPLRLAQYPNEVRHYS